MEELVQKGYALLAVYGFKILMAGAILVLGRWAAGMLCRVTERMMERRKMDETLRSFACNMIYYAFLTFVVLAALSQLGIQTTSFIAVIGAAGLAVGLALQGSLANFASGFLIIMFRPFKVGDFIEGAGVAGTVESLQIFTTLLRTPDNKKIIIPNSSLTGGNITNWSATGTRRVDMMFSIGYDDDIDMAKQVIREILAADERILNEPAPLVALSELADSSVNFVARPWVKSGDYWGVLFDTTEAVKKRFDAAGIRIPYPQQDVHIYQQKAEA